MREAVIVSTARTPVAQAFHGALNDIKSPTLMAYAIRHVVERSRIEPEAFEDVVVGTTLAAGTAGGNIARLAVFAAGLPVSVPGQTVDRQGASGLVAIAIAAGQIDRGGMEACIAGGQDNVSALHQASIDWMQREADALAVHHVQHAYVPAVYTAENIAQRFGISRDAQDRYAAESQRRAVMAHEMGRFGAELVPLQARMKLDDRKSGGYDWKDVLLSTDESVRPDATFETLSQLKPTIEGGAITAGNASPPADGAAACVLAEATYAQRRGLAALGVFRGMAVAAGAPMDAGLAPVLAARKLLARHGLKAGDIGLWELDESFASDALLFHRQMEIDPVLCNVDGGSVALGHVPGMTGVRQVGHALIEGKRRGVRFVVVSMGAGGGAGMAALLEVA